MVRSLTLAVALALGTVSVPAHALGLGDIKARSALNQQFDADIDLLSVATGELDAVRIRLATPEAFKRAGVDRPFFLTLLKFRPERLENGKAVIRVSSDFPIREPFLNFLVEINWPRGKLVREYTVLLDPPTTTRRRAPQVAPAPAAVEVTRPAPVSRRPAAAAATVVGGSEYGPIQANETLWGIAKKVRPRGVSMEQMMMALRQANAQAFIGGNINQLRKGQILRVPGTEEILQISRVEAAKAYRAQQDEWLAARSEQLQRVDGQKTPEATPQPTGEEADAADAASQSAVSGSAQAEDDNLRIATPRPDGTGAAGAGADRGDDSVDDVQRELLAARENVESSRQETAALRGEVDDLQKRLADMQRLLTLKDEQLARLQSGEAAAPDAAVPDTDAPNPLVDEPLDPIEAAMAEAQKQFDQGQAGFNPAEDAVPAEVAVDPAIAEGGDLASAADAVAGAFTTSQLPDAMKAAPADEGATPEPAPDSTPVEADQSSPAAVSDARTPETPAPAPSDDSAAKGMPGGDFLADNWPYLAGGASALLLLLILLLARRRNDDEPAATTASVDAVPSEEEESILQEDVDLGVDGDSQEVPMGGDTSFLSEFSPSDINALRDDTGEVDPVSEADVYIAYGRYQQAEELLKQAMDKDPDRLALKHKLLEVFYATRNKNAFAAQAKDLVDAGQDMADPEAWARAKEMGRELDANNPLFAASADEPRALDSLAIAGAAGVAGAAVAAASDDDNDSLALDEADLSAIAHDLGEEESQAMDAASVDADLSLDLGDLEDALDEDSLPVEGLESLELELPDLDSEELVGSMSPDAGDDAGGDSAMQDSTLKEDSELSAEDLQAQLDELSDLSVLDADLSQMSADIDDSLGLDEPNESTLTLDEPISLDDAFNADAADDTGDSIALDDVPLPEVDEDAVSTKLDLARAYIDMGDSEGAKGILEEVKVEGSEDQKSEATKLLGDIG